MALSDLDTGTFPANQLQERVMADLYGWDGTEWVRVTVSGGGGIVIGATPNRPDFKNNQVDVAAPGTAQQLQAQAIPDGFSIVVRAKSTNTDLVYLSDTQVGAQNHATAFPMAANDFVALFVTDASEIWVDAVVAAEGISWIVES